jgi:CRP/FNR family transcriptional regulator
MHLGSDSLKKLTALQGIMSKDIAELATEFDRAASTVSLRKGDSLFRCGDPVSGVFIVRKGAIRMSLDSSVGPLFPPVTLGPGEIAGLPATLTGTYSLSAEVSEPAELGFIPADRVMDLLECNPRLCLLATRFISREIARMRSALRETPPLDLGSN